MGNLFGQALLLVGVAALATLLYVVHLAARKLVAIVSGKKSEGFEFLVLIGAAIGSVAVGFVPSLSTAPVGHRILLIISFIAIGAFIGDIIGLTAWIVSEHRQNDAKLLPDSVIIKSLYKFTSLLSGLVIGAIILVGGILVILIRLNGMPFFGPLVQFVRHLFGRH